MATEFDPKPFLCKVQGGRKHLMVSGRVAWMRHDKPEWGIETSLLEHKSEIVDNKWIGSAMFKALVKDENGRIIGCGTAQVKSIEFAEYLEKAGDEGARSSAGYSRLRHAVLRRFGRCERRGPVWERCSPTCGCKRLGSGGSKLGTARLLRLRRSIENVAGKPEPKKIRHCSMSAPSNGVRPNPVEAGRRWVNQPTLRTRRSQLMWTICSAGADCSLGMSLLAFERLARLTRQKLCVHTFGLAGIERSMRATATARSGF